MLKITTSVFVAIGTLSCAFASPSGPDSSLQGHIYKLANAAPNDNVLDARDAWSDRVVSLHNTYRAQYGADPLHWDGNLYSGALAWAQKYVFSHSGGSYGENLYAAAPGTGDTLAEGLSSWMSEAAKYNYNDPVFSTDTGHFTQVVWKSTTGVACAVANCASGTIFGQSSQFLVCRYSPPGNYAGEFAKNVGRHK